MKQARILVILLVSYLLVLGVNLAGNYEYYAAGNDWRYSVYFVLTVTTLGWTSGMFLIAPFLERVFRRNWKPTIQLLISVLVLALLGVLIMVVTMKFMVWFFHFQEQSVSSYVSNSIYSVLFTLVFGLMAAGQQFLVHLKKGEEENAQLQKEMIRSQYEALKSQVNPHFLFNSLNTLTVMIPRQPDLAIKFVEQMSKVFRYSLQNSGENVIDVATELKVVQSYLFLNEQRFEGKLITEIRVDEAALERKIITQSLLMLTENAIKHNEISVMKPLTVRILNERDYLVIENSLQRKLLPEESTGMGLVNIKKRYELATPNPVIFEEAADLFIVKIPLL